MNGWGYSSLTIAGWIDEYGPLITVRSGLEKVVIIDRYKAAVEIMENQGGLLTDRPRKVAVGEIFNGGLRIVLTPFEDRFRRMRRALHTHLQPKAAEAYQPLQMSHVKNTVLDILGDPSNFQNHVITFSVATVIKVAYGNNTPTSRTDPQMMEVYKPMELSSYTMRPDTYYLQSNVNVGLSFMKYMLENNDAHGLTEGETAFLAETFLAAGFDSLSIRCQIASAMCIVFLATASFPEEQAKVRAELDEVIGRHRVL
ncbi:cytochrome P450 [Suillus ampliporus]|nr:cytochrome P450 [Suillus ampliporus]